jgi:hypothetical protein
MEKEQKRKEETRLFAMFLAFGMSFAGLVITIIKLCQSPIESVGVLGIVYNFLVVSFFAVFGVAAVREIFKKGVILHLHLHLLLPSLFY